MSVSLNKITKTLMNFRSSRNTFTIFSTCLENQGFSELWGKHFTYCLENQGFSELWRKRSTYFLPGCHLLQSPVCQQWWTVGKFFVQNIFQEILDLICHQTWYFGHSYHWSWWPGEVAKPWSRVNTSGLGHWPIRAHLDFKVKANCLKNHLEAALRKSSPLVIVGSSHQNIGQAGLACWNKIGKHCFDCFGNFGEIPTRGKFDPPTPVAPSSTILQRPIFHWKYFPSMEIFVFTEPKAHN